jgi:nucleoporin POM152
LLFTQDVLQRPAAAFKQRNRLIYCLGDPFTPRSGNTDGVILLQGTPPFLVTLTIKNLAASETQTSVVEVYDRTWKVDLSDYVFKSIGPHLVTIEGVTDASNCERQLSDSFDQTIWVDVAESAAIVPFDRREHFCVGDSSQFQLEGIPPWTIGCVSVYNFLSTH